MRFVLALALAVAASLTLGTALAQVPRPTSRVTEYSPYEQETIRRALKELNLKIDPAPEGKIIRRIDTLRLEVLEDRDPVPEEVLGLKTRKLANSLHYVTRDYIIRRELLQREGDRYLQIMIDETARNMRARMPLQVSLVILLPIETGEPGTVDVLVITKDIWSLRLSFDASVTPGGVENFLLVPQETNLLGYQHTVSTRFQYQPETWTFGTGYSIPRFGYSWIGAAASASVIINRRSGHAEGSAVSASVGQGLYSTRTPWAWSAGAGYSIGIVRRYSNAHVFQYNAVSTDVNDRIPYQYKSQSYTASAGVTRSFGWGFKNNFSLTMNATSAKYDTFGLENAIPAAVNEFKARALPIGETRVYPALTWTTFKNDFLRTLDVNTLSLQEDFRLGHDFSVSVYPVSRALGSTRTLFGVSAKLGYTVPLGKDGLAGASVSTFAEDFEGRISDGSVSGSFGAVTPRVGFGRIVMNTSFTNRYRNYLNARTFAGGDDRLRGYPTNYFFGNDTIFYNLEFRSRSVEILKAQLGGVAFYDAGDVAIDFDALNAKQSVGFGIRALFPQVNRLVFRADFAFPLKRGPFPETGVDTPVDPFGFFFGFDQAFAP